MMHITWGTFDEHAKKLKLGLVKLGPNFVAELCYWCEGTTMHKCEFCDVCSRGRGYAMGLGLLIHGEPAPESVVNQVLVAAERG